MVLIFQIIVSIFIYFGTFDYSSIYEMQYIIIICIYNLSKCYIKGFAKNIFIELINNIPYFFIFMNGLFVRTIEATVARNRISRQRLVGGIWQ